MLGRTGPALAVVVGLMLAVAQLASAPVAADRGAPAGTGGSGSRNSVGAGVSGATGAGGSGSIADPGGAPAGIGNSRSGEETPGTIGARPGYLGGRITSPDAEASGTKTIPAGVAATPESRLGLCNEAHPRMLSPSARLSGINLERLDAASGLLSPEDGTMPYASLRYLLASLQEELARERPDPLLAGTYLGVSAVVPVTADMVAQVGETLCVPVTKDQAADIASVAEGQRLKLQGQAQR